MFRQIQKRPGVLVGLLGLFILILFLFPEMQERPVYFLSRPVVILLSGMQKGLVGIGGGLERFWDRYIHLTSVEEENRRLQGELARVLNENVRLREAALANERLKEALDLKTQRTYSVRVAAVIGRDPSNWYHSLMIDKGERDGVKAEMGVINPSGVVGRVIKTGPSFSQVLLLTDRNSAVAGLVQRTRDEGVVEGTERGLARIKYLSLLATATEGDFLITSGLTGIFPKGIPIGTLGPLTKREPDLFQQAEVTPSVDFSKLEEVLVITSLKGAEAKP